MPIFEYNCSKCNDVFEVMDLSSKFEKTDCPKCGSSKTKRLLSSFAPRATSAASLGSCSPDSCGMPQAPGGMPPCGAGGCGMM